MNYSEKTADIQVLEIIENILCIMPMIHKKLLQTVDIEAGMELTHYHYAILGVLSKRGPSPVSSVGNKLMISKPQMTAIIDRLADLGLVSREPDKTDRRIINISLTSKGRVVLSSATGKIKENVAARIAGLPEADRELLLESLKNLARIGSVL
jgi:DNA-binding MarR family transcriptional regulator